ncbi:MAG: hypothetical protein H6822_24160 [Planctomycetaceae bacterium]|nr:hypothetical protein [Planctomycetales bacterium]MCB9925294.1 hypothetical protein [Planctomycetaceae bacterium]
MKRSALLTTAVLLIAYTGCNRTSQPQPETTNVEPAAKVAATKPDWKLVTLHIDGFKKSKSGGT